jgi:hypothetical protein
MPERDDRDDEPPTPEDLGAELGDQSGEPSWTEEIRRLRRARGDRLKELFDAFDRDEEEAPPE